MMSIEDVWKKKYANEIEELKRMDAQEKFNVLLQLNSLGLKLMDVNNKERKIKFYQRESKLRKEAFKEFIKKQLERI